MFVPVLPAASTVLACRTAALWHILVEFVKRQLSEKGKVSTSIQI